MTLGARHGLSSRARVAVSTIKLTTAGTTDHARIDIDVDVDVDAIMLTLGATTDPAGEPQQN